MVYWAGRIEKEAFQQEAAQNLDDAKNRLSVFELFWAGASGAELIWQQVPVQEILGGLEEHAKALLSP